jgi:hypothetical protein
MKVNQKEGKEVAVADFKTTPAAAHINKENIKNLNQVTSCSSWNSGRICSSKKC